MPVPKEQPFIPTDAREMHARIFSGEATQLPPSLIFFLATIFKNSQEAEVDAAQPLLDSIEGEVAAIEESLEEQTIARTLLLRFGLPYLPGAEEIWVILSEYLDNAKEATEQTQLQLKETVAQIQALLITQLTTEHQEQLESLELEEEQHRQGITTLQKAEVSFVDEDQLADQNDEAITQKRDRLTFISTQKRQLQNSIESMRAMVSNLLINFTNVQQFDSTQLVMA